MALIFFDASFFGFNAREAEITEPQQLVWNVRGSDGRTPGMPVTNYSGPPSASTAGFPAIDVHVVYNLFANPDVMRNRQAGFSWRSLATAS